jgi:TM2 domain-containing membrane protein YozV
MPKFCSNCGEKLNENQDVCLKCGVKVKKEEKNDDPEAKSKIVAGILGILVGSFGAHNFYLGYNQKAVAQLLLTTIGWILLGLGPVIAGIWGLIEGIMILVGSIDKDAKGIKLKD